MDGAWISLGHCTYDKWCLCWMRVMFRTSFKGISHRWCTLNMSTSFHEVLFTSKAVKIIYITLYFSQKNVNLNVRGYSTISNNRKGMTFLHHVGKSWHHTNSPFLTHYTHTHARARARTHTHTHTHVYNQ
jgi:hypothetical protein